MDSLAFFETAAVLLVGLAAGFINTVAGGGSLLSLPALIFLGLDPVVANGTNRIAILAQNINGVLAFRHRGHFHGKLAVTLALPALAGAYLGSMVAIRIEGETFNRILAVVMVGVVLYSAFGGRGRGSEGPPELRGAGKWVTPVIFAGIGFYGGFVQAGVGFLILAALAGYCRFDLLTANSLKVFVVLVYTTLALTNFALGGKIDWALGGALAVGNSVGAWAGAHWSVAKGELWIRRVLYAAVVVFAVRLFFFS